MHWQFLCAWQGTSQFQKHCVQAFCEGCDRLIYAVIILDRVRCRGYFCCSYYFKHWQSLVTSPSDHLGFNTRSPLTYSFPRCLLGRLWGLFSSFEVPVRIYVIVRTLHKLLQEVWRVHTKVHEQMSVNVLIFHSRVFTVGLINQNSIHPQWSVIIWSRGRTNHVHLVARTIEFFFCGGTEYFQYNCCIFSQYVQKYVSVHMHETERAMWGWGLQLIRELWVLNMERVLCHLSGVSNLEVTYSSENLWTSVWSRGTVETSTPFRWKVSKESNFQAQHWQYGVKL